jgi:hypothetical protein
MITIKGNLNGIKELLKGSRKNTIGINLIFSQIETTPTSQ